MDPIITSLKESVRVCFSRLEQIALNDFRIIAKEPTTNCWVIVVKGGKGLGSRRGITSGKISRDNFSKVNV